MRSSPSVVWCFQTGTLIAAVASLITHAVCSRTQSQEAKQVPSAPQVVTAQGFVLTDAEGNVRAKLGFSTLGYSEGRDPWLEFFTKAGECTLRVGLDRDDPGAWFGREGACSLSLGSEPHAGMTIYDASGRQRVRLRLENDSEPDLGFLDDKGRILAELHSVAIGDDSSYSTRLSVCDGQAKGEMLAQGTGAFLEAGPRDGAKLLFRDKENEAVLGCGLQPDGVRWATPRSFEEWDDTDD